MEQPDALKDRDILKQAVDAILQNSIDVPITVNHPNILHKLGLKRKR